MVDDPRATLSLLTQRPEEGARLLVIEGVSSLIVGLPATGTVTIGRAPECDVRLSDAACSRRHAQIHATDEG